MIQPLSRRGTYLEPDSDWKRTMRRCSSVVEQRFRKAKVGGSNPPIGSNRYRVPLIYIDSWL